MDTFASALESILINLFSSDIGDKSKGIVYWLKVRSLKKRIDNWCTEYEKKHDGTILTEGRFLHFIQYHNPIDAIFSFKLDPNPHKSEDAFLTELVQKTCDTVEGKIDAYERGIVKNFYSDVNDIIDTFYLSVLSPKDRIYLHNSNCASKMAIEVLSRGLEESKEDVKRHISLSELSEKETIAIFHALDERFWKADFDSLMTFCSGFEGKSKDLVLWLKLCLKLVLKESPYTIDLKEYQNISSNTIKDDVVRKAFLFSYLSNEIESFSMLSYSVELNELIRKIREGDLSDVYTESVEKKNNISFVGINLVKNHKETWLTKRILILEMLNKSYLGLSNAMESIRESDGDFLIDLIVSYQRISERIQNNQDYSDNQFEIIWNKRNIYQMMNPYIQDYFWASALTYYLHEHSKLKEVINEIPNEIARRDMISSSIVMAKIELDESNIDEIISLSKDGKKTWLLNNYFVSKQDPILVTEVIEKNPSFLRDPVLFFDYIRSLQLLKQYDEEKKVLEDYRIYYQNFIEFWIHLIEVSKDKNAVDEAEKRWLAGKMKYISPMAEEALEEIFYQYGKYESCISIFESLRTKGAVSIIDSRYHINSLVLSDKKIEALNELLTIFPSNQNEEFVVNNILSLSRDLRRTVDEEVLQAALRINTPLSVVLSAQILERSGRHEEAKKAFRKALVLNNDVDDRVFGLFWDFSVRESTADARTIEYIDEDTTAYLKNMNTGELEIICISKNEFLPQKEYLWNGIMHISLDVAVEKGLLRKKVGDIITIKQSDFEVKDIISLECFYDRFCLNKMLKNKYVKAFTAPEKELDTNILTNWLKENVEDRKDGQLFFAEYRDFARIPMPLFFLAGFSLLSYSQFVYAILKSDDYVIREYFDYNRSQNNVNNSGYVLSFSAMILFYLIGVPASVINDHNVVIPESYRVFLHEEKESIVSSTNKDFVGSIGLVEEKLFINSPTEEQKLEIMQHAVELFNYASELLQSKNSSSLKGNPVSESDLIQLIGMFDYDALSICQATGKTLISTEQFISDIARLPGIEIDCICAVDALSQWEMPIVETIGYLKQLVQLHVINILNIEVLEKVAILKDSDDSGIITIWKDFLDEIDKTRGMYRELLRNEITLFMRRIFEKYTDMPNAYIRLIASLAMKLNSYKFVTYQNEVGELMLGVVKEPYDDVIENK